MNPHKRLKEYGGYILNDGYGTLEMRDPNDNARHRYQYRVINGKPCKRTLPECGDYDPPAQWEPYDVRALARIYAGTYNPIVEYFRETL